jgi:hypothetical protein
VAKIELLFSRRVHPGSAVIRAFTWSAWSHVDVLDSATRYERLFGATAKDGVQWGKTEDRIDHASRYAFASVDTDVHPVQLASFWMFLGRQEGKAYDWSAVFGIGIHRDWAEDDKWFCSELVAAAFGHVGIELAHKKLNRVTPQDLWESPLLTDRSEVSK